MKIVNKETGIGNVQFKKVMCGKDKLSETKAEKKKELYRHAKTRLLSKKQLGNCSIH